MVHKIGNEKEQELVDKLRTEGKTLYSISRLNTFNGCQYEYYLTYNMRNRGEQNVYSEIGTFVHDYIENVYRGEIDDTSDFKRKLNMNMFKLDMKGMTFPNETIENAFKSDMFHFCDNFNKLDGSFTLEKMYVAKFGEYYLYGYIDAIQDILDSDDEIELKERNIIDWKTSSKFSGSKLVDAGRQLIVYKLGLEQTGLKIDKVMWNMLKYCYVCNVQKNKKIKRKMVNRGKLIKEMRNNFTKVMLNNNMAEFEVDIILGEVAKDNDFDKLPQCVKDEYWIEDCLLEYEVSDEKVEEVQQYIINTIKEIESKDKDNESQWRPLNIDKENFYCNTLCGHRNSCKYLAEWKRKNPFKKIGF